ncbi:MAG: lytic murein transglycosylase [Legionella sp. 40-6]|nr:transglycosylase SLT domain-containing protein [Legionella sp.]OJY44190.1 MAG: lytic murein transglycosylase [Legionella sp. 40-6]
MKKIFFYCWWFFSCSSLAFNAPEYLERFNTYLNFNQHLPVKATPEFIAFIEQDQPLSRKLRERWLYELARLQDWQTYRQYYHASKDINLVCYYQIAQYRTGHNQDAFTATLPLWLTGDSQPPACDQLFNLFIQDPQFNTELLTQRFALALERRNLPLARYLLKHDPQAKILTSMFELIIRNPALIAQLKPSNINREFYLYGLKRLISLNKTEKALALWKQAQSTHFLSEAQQQNFLAYLALYKAMRNSEDAPEWFAQIKPEYQTELVTDWQIRFALKHGNWAQVHTLIIQKNDRDSPCWQYWLARSLAAEGNQDEAQALYKNLAQTRNYYGFLASLRLKQTPNFVNEPVTTDLQRLIPFKELLSQIQKLYQSRSLGTASRLLNDFISELPKEESSALIYWIDQVLGWHGKSIYLSNTELFNNQLALRFPLAYSQVVKSNAQKYGINPELILAIIRQESSFREDATSSAGARGLMQVMPYTAGVVSKAYKIPYTSPEQLFTSDKNINIGVAYLKQLAQRFKNHPILIAAAYNAGPKQVVYWLQHHTPKDMDVWIETLPWQETRNYLKNIFAFYIVYQYRLDKKPSADHFLHAV